MINIVSEKPFPDEVECGDIYLVGFECVNEIRKDRVLIDWHVITAEEYGWSDVNGDPWDEEIEMVKYWMRLPEKPSQIKKGMR